MSLKLYRVTCRGMTYSVGGGTIYGIAYVVADDLDEAYNKVRDSLYKRDLGFPKERELDKIELMAEFSEFPKCGISLYI